MNQRLIIFTRYPEAGKTKSRLIPLLGPQGAADLQREMTAHTLRWATGLNRRHSVSVEVRFASGDALRMQRCFGNSVPFCRQGDGDLGRRMSRAFHKSFASGMDRVAVVGSDCPELTPQLVRQAFQRLDECDLVLGPASDGGYYLIGLNDSAPRLFEQISWGTSRVLEQTLRAAARENLSVARLKTLADVDRPADLDVWKQVRERVSVIIPVLNEAAFLPATLASLEGAANVEVILADAGSRDESGTIARSHRAQVIQVARGRARQMNAGAAAATGALLLFLHADTRLPAGFEGHVRRALRDPRVAAGAFRLSIEGASGPLRVIERVANLRARYLHMPYGDQALFMRRELFERVGGFPELPIMEDYEMVRRLRRRGRIAIVPAEVTTSARRWHALGVWRTTWINQTTVLAYQLGIPPERLQQRYRRVQ